MFDNDIKKVKELVVRGVVRDSPIAPEPTFLAKTMHTNETLFFLPKDWQQYKTASKEQKDRIKYLFKHNMEISSCSSMCRYSVFSR